ncbi:carbohydrate ABC transporter permease [Microbacterium sp. p3-SID336]|uniref:carbohydrate ABC transporter permease n=1 Tax=Microbacterium sp. p3-SID336 TaxID=2916212 RepID=UPI0021A8B9D0|nr:sugar ABC transporter permease [Microbacterium sp. p3-SID336]MCT1478264.1 sugar ABC transporter permease [Microbacterium sp. p3-SID336]
MRTRTRTVHLTGLLFILPSLLVVVSLLFYPVVSSIFFSFTDRHLLRTDFDFVGIDNFVAVLQNPQFWNAFRTSILWTVASILGQLVIGFLAALALNRIRHLTGLFRTLLIIPWAFPAIVIAFGWRWILNDVYGFLPNLLTRLGLTESNVSFLSNPDVVMATVLAINIWFGAPLFMVNILAALKTVPREQFEAATVDGASGLQRFAYITLPHVKKVIGLLVILRSIWVFNNFELLFLLTGGGPAGLTETLPIFAYRTGWGLQQLGVASAVTVLLLVFLLALGALAFRLLNRWDTKDAS